MRKTKWRRENWLGRVERSCGRAKGGAGFPWGLGGCGDRVGREEGLQGSRGSHRSWQCPAKRLGVASKRSVCDLYQKCVDSTRVRL